MLKLNIDKVTVITLKSPLQVIPPVCHAAITAAVCRSPLNLVLSVWLSTPGDNPNFFGFDDAEGRSSTVSRVEFVQV
jgi:hypothetical protein